MRHYNLSMPISLYCLSTSGMTPIRTKGVTPDEITRQLPNGIYTTFSTTQAGTRVPGLTLHLNRLYSPAQAEGCVPSVTRLQLRKFLGDLSKRAFPGESRYRILINLGDGKIYVIHQSFTPPPQFIYEKGVKVVTANIIREDPRIKNSGFIEKSIKERKLVGQEIYEVLLTHNGRIFEGMTSNFYVVKNNVETEMVDGTIEGSSAALITARNGILMGVTRHIVLQLARKTGLTRFYRAPLLEESFTEAFITSSSRGIVPVVSIDDRLVGEGRVGEWTNKLIRVYSLYAIRFSEVISPS